MHSLLRFLPHVFLKGRPIHLTLFLTRRCNARCPFCFYLEDGNIGREPELSLSEIESVSKGLGSLMWLAFSGGEIFLRDDLPEACSIFYTNNRPSIILLPTNGLMPERIATMTRRVLEACPKSIVAVKLSIDAIGEAHDSIRGVAGGFEKVIETHGLLKGLLGEFRNFELGVNTVFSASNQHQVDDVIDFVHGMDGIRTHTISLARGEISEEHKGADMALYAKAIERIERELYSGKAPTYSFGGARIKAAQDILQRRMIHDTRVEGTRQTKCYAGRLNLVVSHQGDVYPCENFSPEFRMGSIRESGLRNIMASPETGRMLDKIARECFCTHECYMMTNILFNPANSLRLLRTAARIG